MRAVVQRVTRGSVRVGDEPLGQIERGLVVLLGIKGGDSNPEATRKKFAGEFLLTGDLGVQDEDGYFWYVSREDDVITTAGYRVGPSEIEHTLMKHPSATARKLVSWLAASSRSRSYKVARPWDR